MQTQTESADSAQMIQVCTSGEGKDGSQGGLVATRLSLVIMSRRLEVLKMVELQIASANTEGGLQDSTNSAPASISTLSTGTPYSYA